MTYQDFSFLVRVYIEDADPGGIVYYVNYLKYMERARTEFMRTLGFDRSATFSKELMFVVRDIEARYIAPAFLDDELCVTAAVLRVGGASFNLHQSVLRNNESIVECDLCLAAVNRSSMMPCRLPKDMFLALRSEVSL